MTTLVNRTHAAGATSEPIRLSELLHILRRRSAFIAICGLAGALLGLVYARTLLPQFTAFSLIAVEGDRFAIPELRGALSNDNIPDPMPIVRTEMQALNSPDLVRGVVEHLYLADLPEFNAELRPPGLLKSLRTELFPDTTPPPSREQIEDSVVNTVLHSLSIFQDNRSLAIEVSFTSENAARSADVINTLVADYIKSRADRRLSANRDANGAMTKRTDELRQEIVDLEKRIQDLRDRNGLVLLRAGSVGQQQLEELTTALARASVERAELQTSYDRATTLVQQGNSDALSGVLSSPTITQLRQQEATASQRVAELSAHHGSGYPALASARAELAAARGQLASETQRIVASIASQLSIARQRETDLNRQLDETRQTALQSENARADLEQLQQEVTSRRALYQTLLERTQQTADQPISSVTPDVHVITTATPPTFPSGPHVRLLGGLGGLGGLLFGSLLMLSRARGLDAASNPAQFEQETGMTVLSCLPQESLRRGRRNLLELVRGNTAEAQAVRGIRAKLRQMGRTRMPRVVMFSAAAREDHAAILAIALGRVAVADGEAVLVIECDPQHPRLAQLLNLRGGAAPQYEGLQEDWRDLLIGDSDALVDLLLPTSAMLRDWPHGTLFQNALVEAMEEYDLVLLVGPEANSAAAVTIAQHADVGVIVLGPGMERGTERSIADRYPGTARGALGAVVFGRSEVGKVEGVRT